MFFKKVLILALCFISGANLSAMGYFVGPAVDLPGASIESYVGKAVEIAAMNFGGITTPVPWSIENGQESVSAQYHLASPLKWGIDKLGLYVSGKSAADNTIRKIPVSCQGTVINEAEALTAAAIVIQNDYGLVSMLKNESTDTIYSFTFGYSKGLQQYGYIAEAFALIDICGGVDPAVSDLIQNYYPDAETWTLAVRKITSKYSKTIDLHANVLLRPRGFDPSDGSQVEISLDVAGNEKIINMIAKKFPKEMGIVRSVLCGVAFLRSFCGIDELLTKKSDPGKFLKSIDSRTVADRLEASYDGAFPQSRIDSNSHSSKPRSTLKVPADEMK